MQLMKLSEQKTIYLTKTYFLSNKFFIITYLAFAREEKLIRYGMSEAPCHIPRFWGLYSSGSGFSYYTLSPKFLTESENNFLSKLNFWVL